MRFFARSLFASISFVLFIFLFSSNINAAELQPGSVWQWNNATGSATQKEGLSNIVSVSAGSNHSLALKNDGTVWAWGTNDYGQLGIGTSGGNSMDPVQVKGPDGAGFLTDVKAIAAGTSWFSMVLKKDGSVWVWGNNNYGARGAGIGSGDSSSKILTPRQVKGVGNSGFLLEIIAIAAGGDHSLALKSNGNVVAWGRNDQGQIGNGCSSYCSVVSWPMQITSNVTSISAGDTHSLAMKTDGTIWGWGRTYEGQLGTINGIYGIQGVPVQIPGISAIKNIWSKGAWNIALSGDGKIFEWGHRFSPDDRNPRQVPELDNVTIAAVGPSYLSNYAVGAAVKKDGSAWQWNADKNDIPKQIPNLSSIGSITLGTYVSNLVAVKIPDPTPTPTPIPKTPLILIPGIGGSELKTTGVTIWDAPDGHGGTFSHVYPEEKVWVNVIEAIKPGNDDYFDILKMDQDGTSVANLTVTGSLFDGYSGVINFFESNGYTLNKDFFLFPYDWRQDVSLTVPLLDQKIEKIKKQTGNQKVDIVAHSMGGLVARNYISDLDRASNVRKLFTLGTPHLGSVQFLRNLRSGGCMTLPRYSSLPICLGVTSSQVKDVIQNMISAYELAPTSKYFDFYSGEDPTHLYPVNDMGDVDKNGITGALNYLQTKTFLNNLGHNTALYYPAQVFHGIDSDLANTNGVEVFNIAGSGLPTVGQIKEGYTTNILGFKVPHKDEIFINGDETVPLMSASLVDYDKNLSLLGDAKIYYTNQEHGSLVSSGSALLLVKNILNGDDSLPEGASVKPYPFKGTVVSGHSPIDINIYDNSGNHTGLTEDGNIEANIPGSFYDSLDDAKFIYLPNDGKYSIKIASTGEGSFDLNIRKFQNRVNTTTAFYNNVPLGVDTQLNTDLDTSSDAVPVLSVDENGDGVYDGKINYTAILSGDEEYETNPTPTLTPTPTTAISSSTTNNFSDTQTSNSNNGSVLTAIGVNEPAIEKKENILSGIVDVAGAETFKQGNINNDNNTIIIVVMIFLGGITAGFKWKRIVKNKLRFFIDRLLKKLPNYKNNNKPK